MSQVKRYVTTCDCMSEAAWGDYVRHNDYAALEAECERLRADAERYRWLRDSEQLEPDQFGALNEWLWGDGDFTYVASAIDAALSAKP